MSYRRAWLLVESLNRSFRKPVTFASTGGKDGGGMLVTEFGEALIRNYRALEQEFATLAERRLRLTMARITRRSKSGTKLSPGTPRRSVRGALRLR